VLGSLRNPLPTRLVKQIVFSTRFRSRIDNSPAYLRTGIVLWNSFK
jgi:hypothetical protein